MPCSVACLDNLVFKISRPCSGKLNNGAMRLVLLGSGTTWLSFKFGSIFAKSVWVNFNWRA